MEVLGSVAAHALFTSWAVESIQVTARTDALTGLSNRRFLDEQMDRVLAESTRYGDPAALILLDLDYFKAINDTHGHLVGDQVLCHVAATLQDGVRGVDVCARYGGEELAVLLPRTGLQGAVELAERLREMLEKRPLQLNGNPLQVTASFGVASFPRDAPTSQALLSSADSALYRAKLAGRNRVRSAQAKL
jgi:diguanylate cyclase (GGDEF)-like protein